MEEKDILFKFQLPISHFNSCYHDITSKIRQFNGTMITHDKVDSHILFEIKFDSYKELTDFQRNLNFTIEHIG